MIALNANQLLAEVDSMPLDLKIKLIDKRVDAIEAGTVSLLDGNEVFQKFENISEGNLN